MSSPHAVALSYFAPFGSRTYVRLFEKFSTFEDIWNATEVDLLELGLSENAVKKFSAWRKDIDPQTCVDEVAKLGIETIDRDDARFPAVLKTIYDPPIILYVQGQLPTTDNMFGIVGSRDATEYGLSTARQFAGELARAGLIIVSGLARGIDTAAHEGAMAVGGKTIAVLAHGHQDLKGSKLAFAKKIVANGGAVITEQPPHVTAEKFHFPIRNRIIAGLSQGVLIVEAELPSGSLITAQCALNSSREVFAVPGPINSPFSTGTNKLIQDGAHVASSTTDILSVFGMSAPTAPILVRPEPGVAASPEEATLLACLTFEPIHVDDLARSTKLETSVLLGTLTLMEISGKVRHLGNQYYSL